jgi:DNA-binding MarR family transcriptional regulator
MSRFNLTGVIEGLVERGLVTRTEDQADGCLNSVQTIEKGEALISDLGKRRINHLFKALSELGAKDLGVIVQRLELLASATEAQAQQRLTRNEICNSWPLSSIPRLINPPNIWILPKTGTDSFFHILALDHT